MIASLPMYDWPQVRPATDRLWALIRDNLRDAGQTAPDALDRTTAPWDCWLNPALTLSQTCGMPYRTRLHGQVTMVGTPDFALPDASPGHYYSQLVVRADAPGELADFVTGRLAFNALDSQSGWAAPQNHVAAFGARFCHVLQTGAHRDSARAVAEGRADIAAIDAVTWRLYTAHFPQESARLRVLGHTHPTPGLPLITAVGRDPAPIFAAISAAFAALAPQDRAALGLFGLASIPADAYLSVPTPPAPSQDAPAA
jgi:ABC-type phosphate/phosphonate transport system substrate-binding protein